MCGFVGIASPAHERVVARHELERMLAPIAYRGPDDEVFEERPGFGVGFRRLAIVDTEHGRQPMSTSDGRLTLVCNGEIYNHAALRNELAAKGHGFRTRSDSEVVLHAYAAWGARCAERLRGIFAFAIWDAHARTVFLCRDRSGVKPLFLRVHGDELLFASEAKAILAHPDVPRRLDLVACFAIPEGEEDLVPSPFADIQQLGAGMTLSFGPDLELRTRRYWTYAPTIEPGDGSRDEHDIERFRDELGRVVEMQLMSDVPLGACLSGGLDSSLIAALASTRTPGFSTFTTVFEGSLDPWFAFSLSRSKGLQSHFLRFDPAAMTGALPLVAWGAEGLFDLAFASRLQLCSFAREGGVRVLLSGQGIDELTGGYDKTYGAMAAAATRAAASARLLHSGLHEIAELIAGPTSGKERGTVARDVASSLRSQHAYLGHYLLPFEDRMGMLAGVEVRVPFLDHELVELCARISPERRASLFGDKRLVREAAKGLVPDSVRLREKYAFNASMPPITRVLECCGDSELHSLTDDATVRTKGYFDPKRVTYLRETRSERLLDAVFVVHLLDELFVSRFDPARFAGARPPRAHEVQIDERWMPAEAMLFSARRHARPSDTPSLDREITFVGLLHAVTPNRTSQGERRLVVRTSAGQDRLVTLPDQLDPDLALACLLAMDGRKTYAQLAATTSAALADVLAIAQILGQKGLIEHVTPAAAISKGGD